jgi:hypothetical protein
MITHKLMIKTHNKTGLKYLCYTRKKDHNNYSGSGINWLNHLLEHGFDFSTNLLLATNDFETFKFYAVEISILNNVVQSNEWANLKIEEGDGGDTVSNKKWITNGSVDKYLTNDLNLPLGWKYGRSNSVFNDSKKQKEFNSRVNQEKKGKSIKKAWKEGKVIRDHSKCGTYGELNPSKRSDVKEKMRRDRIMLRTVCTFRRVFNFC